MVAMAMVTYPIIEATLSSGYRSLIMARDSTTKVADAACITRAASKISNVGATILMSVPIMNSTDDHNITGRRPNRSESGDINI